jgi:hypothetical protein
MRMLKKYWWVVAAGIAIYYFRDKIKDMLGMKPAEAPTAKSVETSLDLEV